MTFEVNMFDRVGHDSYREFYEFVDIVDRNPDRALPVVVGFGLSSDTVDTRTAAGTLTPTVHVTDDASGAEHVYACPSHQSDSYWIQDDGCTMLSLVAGTALDGTWRGAVPFPAHSLAGDWDMDIWVEDSVHGGNPGYYLGPESYSSRTSGPGGADHPTTFRLPGGRGHFSVLGTGDAAPPELSTIAISPSSIDTLPSAQTVTFDIAARDDVGIRRVWLMLDGPEGSSSRVQMFWGSQTAPASGTAADGVWHFDVVVPQGTPAGTYDVQVLLQDNNHNRGWVSATSIGAGQNNATALTAQQTPGTDGTVKVVEHPSSP